MGWKEQMEAELARIEKARKLAKEYMKSLDEAEKATREMMIQMEYVTR